MEKKEYVQPHDGNLPFLQWHAAIFFPIKSVLQHIFTLAGNHTTSALIPYLKIDHSISLVV